MKKVVTVMLLAGFLVFLAGCGSGSGSPAVYTGNGYTQETQPPATTATPTPTTTLAPQTQETVASHVSHTDSFSHQNGIPAWLLTGVELYLSGGQAGTDVAQWYSNAISRGLPGLTDEWFIPHFLEDELAESVHAVAYAFVRHLSEIGELDNMIALYWRDCELWHDAESWSVAQVRMAEEVRAELWADFVGAEVAVQDIIFQYTFSDYQELRSVRGSGNFVDNMLFNVLAQEGWYFFTQSDAWTREIIAHYLEVNEESIRFVGDWLGYHHAKPLISVHVADESFGISAAGRFWGAEGRPRTIDTRGAVGSPVADLVHTHEVVHALLHLAPHIQRSNIDDVPPEFLAQTPGFNISDFGVGDWYHSYAQLMLEEGFCMLLQYLFTYYTQNDVKAVALSEIVILSTLQWLDTYGGGTDMDFIMGMIEYYNATGGFVTFEEFIKFADTFFGDMITTDASGENGGRRATRDEIVKYMHFSAFQRVHGLHFRHFEDIFDMQGAIQAGVPYAELMDHYTAASFFLYLLEHRGTREDFLTVYQDVHQMEALYGLSLRYMIAEWQAYLDSLFSEWMQTRETEVELPDVVLEWYGMFFEIYGDWFNEWLIANM